MPTNPINKIDKAMDNPTTPSANLLYQSQHKDAETKQVKSYTETIRKKKPIFTADRYQATNKLLFDSDAIVNNQ